MTYAFTFDAAFCSGCKACQAACKDKNNLPLGVLWRRVYEVSGGAWQKDGEAWNNTVFAYNLSIACNHCIHPKCAGVCPTRAYHVREDGIVVLDTTKCMGCGYCAWACPYDAPQYNPEAGVMTKCNLCFDNLEQGLPPACVAACPMRALDYKDVPEDEDLANNKIKLWQCSASAHPFPLSKYSRAQPRLAIRPHPAMKGAEEKSVANLEEIQPRPPSKREDVPLIIFTLLVQMAVGIYVVMAATSLFSIRASFQLLPSLIVGLCLGTGMLAALTHLGNKKNAWRALSHVRSSRMSREILFLILFGIGWLLTTVVSVRQSPGLAWVAVTAVLGARLIYIMAEVYRLPAVPAWNTGQTNASFLVSALLLGLSMMATQWADSFPAFWAVANNLILILLLAEISLLNQNLCASPWRNIRSGLLSFGILLALIGNLQPSVEPALISILHVLVIMMEETIGRWLFYRSRTISF